MNEQSCKYRFEVSVNCDKAHVVNKMDHWCWQNRVINRVDQYCELQWDICVIEWMILSLFSDFHSSTLLKTDEQRIWYKRIIHSIIQSFAFVFISWMHDCGIESMPILYAIIYPGPTNNKANKNSNNNEIG